MIGRASTSSSFNYQWTYDVFINFRGEDTRHGFTGNLYHALTQKGVHTFIDHKELEKGDEITPTLLKAIEESRMAITIFSGNYASSTFCLNELDKIVHFIKRKSRLVWPIFYDIEPSDVRHQKGKYGQALAMHVEHSKASQDDIKRWKIALREVANISGSHFSPRNGQYEYEFIESIVEKISSKINRVPLYIAKYPVGLESRVQKINSLLQIWSKDEVSMVGICGIGGSGKTTIARAVYNSIADNFEGLCFLHDIKENSRKLGLEQMQGRMLSKIVGLDIKIDDVNEGIPIIKRRLNQKRILLILDNVDKREQLDNLAGECTWFGSRSRIIITTRDRQLLLRHGVERIYDMEAFNDEESLELLTWNAFRNRQVDPSYMEVLNHVVHYVQGLPLALEIIGSHLFGMNINEWESALDVYRQIPHKDIQKILEVSYDGLGKIEQEIFLDIACFFQGKEFDYVVDMVELANDYDPRHGIKVLELKSLIRTENGRIKMHDLIQDMGREIIRQESQKEPGKRSRLWFNEDIVHVLEENTGTNEVKIIIQDNSSECIEVDWDGEAFKNMKNLKILVFEKAMFSKGPKYLPKGLRVLKWPRYPSSYLPLDFCAKKLVIFSLPDNFLNSLEQIMKMKNLGVLNLGGSQNIKQIPNLSCIPNLKKLWLYSCKNLVEIHESVGSLAKLEILDVGSCVQLETFPQNLKLPCLKVLYLSHCSSLKYFPEIPEKMECISYLDLVGTGIEKLPFSFCNLTGLEHLKIAKVREEFELPSSIAMLPHLRYVEVEKCGKLLPFKPNEGQEDVRFIRPMNELNIGLQQCNIPDEVLSIYLSWFITLSQLDLTGSSFTILPACIKECFFLYAIWLNECKHLREVQGISPRMNYLNARNCLSLSSESRSLLLSEEVVIAIIRGSLATSLEGNIFMPGASIPEWFDHCSRGSSISFKFRTEFPQLLVCAVTPAGDANSSCHPCCHIAFSLFINGKALRTHVLKDMYPQKDYHITMIGIQESQWDPQWFLEGQLHPIWFQEGQWNLVQIHSGSTFPYTQSTHFFEAKQIGIYVINKEFFGMENIQFISDPPDVELSLHPCWEERVINDRRPMLSSPSRIEKLYAHYKALAIVSDSSNETNAEPVLNKKRKSQEEETFGSSSTAIPFRCTKRGGNCCGNEDENNSNTTQTQSPNSSDDSTTHQVPPTFDAQEKEARSCSDDSKCISLSLCTSHDGINKASDSRYTTNATISSNQGNNSNNGCEWLSLLPIWEAPFHGSTTHQEFQPRHNLSSINLEEIPESSSEDVRKAKGKEIIVHNDNINEK